VAAQILCWHELRIPGPLQSDHYMHAQFGSNGQIDVTPAVIVRRRRRRLFEATHLRRYHCLMYEEALHRAARDFGDPVARDQIDFLLSLVEGADAGGTTNERVKISLVPRDIRVPDPPGDFTVLQFTGSETDRLYLEYSKNGMYIKAKDKVADAIDDWSRLSELALDATDTVDLLRRLRKEFPAGALPDIPMS